MLGGLYEVKASGEETAGASTIMQMTIPVGAGPPPHTRPGSESVYFLDGTARFHVGDETYDGAPGSFFYFPIRHRGNLRTRFDGRLLVVYEPGGIDRFFAEVGEPATAREVPPRSETPPDLQMIATVGERYGMQIQIPAE